MDNVWDQAQETFRRERKPAVRHHATLARLDFGERVRELREARGLSQRQAGGELISRSFMSRVESGNRLGLGVTVLQALTLSMPDVRFVIEAGELRIEELPGVSSGSPETDRPLSAI
jgi:hypothetical protein